MARKAGKALKMNTQSPNSPAYLTMSEYSIKAGISLSQVKRLKLANRLPFIQEGRSEHGYTHVDSYYQYWSGNFKHWIQYRQLIDNQNLTEAFKYEDCNGTV